MRKWKKVYLLFKKNWLIQFRDSFQKLLDILLIILTCLILRSVDSSYNSNHFEAIRYQPFSTKCSWKYQEEFIVISEAVFSPENSALHEMVKNITNSLGFTLINKNSSRESYEFLVENGENSFGIQFDDEFSKSNELPKVLNYVLSFRARNYFDDWKVDQIKSLTIHDKEPRNFGLAKGVSDEHRTLCFLEIQNKIDRYFISDRVGTENKSLPETVVQRFPNREFSTDASFPILSYLGPLLIAICFTFSVETIVMYLAWERECNLKIYLKILGLPRKLQWRAWFAKVLSYNLISITIFTLMLTNLVSGGTDSTVFFYSNPLLIWNFILFYVISMILFCFFMSLFFKKAKIATVVAVIVWIVSYVPYNLFFIQSDVLEDASTFPHFLVSLFPNTGMGFGFSTIIALEQKDVGLQWSNLFSRNERTKISVGEVILSFLLSSVIFIFMIVHMEESDIEVTKPKKWGYPFNYFYEKLFKLSYENLNEAPQVIVDNNNFEKDQNDSTTKALSAEHLIKFHNKNKKVNNVSFTTFWKQTHVLLGLNNSGKSSIISMLATVTKPNCGVISMEGKDIELDMIAYRNSLGICFQGSIAIDNLTVKENIEFFCNLREVKEVQNEVDKYVELLHLQLSLNIRAGKLNKADKRKLSIALGFCGNPKVVLLDEPTIGLEVEDRNRVLDLIRNEKSEKTILIATHSSDEAEEIGDRITILDKGNIVSSGSVSFLKKRFGVGYRLICQKQEMFESENITDLLRNWVPDIVVQSDIGTEVTYIFEESLRSSFPELLRTLEMESEKLGIISFNLTQTNLEDVIMKINEDSKLLNDEVIAKDEIHTTSEEQPIFNSFDSEIVRRHQGYLLILNQILAILKKKLYYLCHNWKFVLFNIIITLLYVLFVLVLPENKTSDYPSLKISLANYSNTNVYLQTDNSSAAVMYEEIVGKSQNIVTVPFNMNMNDYILQNGSNYVIGATFNQSVITAWYNNEYYHSQPLSLTLINQALLKTLAGKEYDLSVTNKPFYFSRLDWFEHEDTNLNSTRIITTLLLVYTFWIMTFITPHIKEKTSGAKLLQYLCGFNKVLFWITTLLIDLVVFTLIALLVILTVGFVTYKTHFTIRIGHLVIVSGFFGFSSLSWMYLTTLFSKEAFDSKINTLLFASTSGLLLIINTLIYTEGHFSWLQYVLRLSPYYEFGSILHRTTFFSYEEINQHQCGGLCSVDDLCHVSHFFCSNSFLVSWYLFLGGAFFFGIVLLRESQIIPKFFLKRKQIKENEMEDLMESDILAEKAKVDSMSPAEMAENCVVIKNVTYLKRSVPRIKNFYLTVQDASCFGILGSKKSGKSLIAKAMAGEIFAYKGEVFIKSRNIQSSPYDLYQKIGYCPDNNAILKYLSGRENLEIFGLAKGIPRSIVQKELRSLADSLNFSEYLPKIVKTYSEAVLRKLCIAIALIGDPTVVILDEPTEELDPVSKRQLFRLLSKMRHDGKTIILTSSNLKECELFCNKIAMMVVGKLRCIGTPDSLRDKYSKGIQVDIKLKPLEESIKLSQCTEIKSYIERIFPNLRLSNETLNELSYTIDKENLVWSKLFETLEYLKQKFQIENYTFADLCLEHFFNSQLKDPQTDL